MLQRYARLKDERVIKLHILSVDAITNEDNELDLSAGSNLLAELHDDLPENFLPCEKRGEDSKTPGQTAVAGYMYDREQNVFRQPQPFASWLFNQETWEWDPPVSKPLDGEHYYWDESVTEWKIAEPIPEQ